MLASSNERKESLTSDQLHDRTPQGGEQYLVPNMCISYADHITVEVYL